VVELGGQHDARVGLGGAAGHDPHDPNPAGRRPAGGGGRLGLLLVVIFATIGALIVARQPANLIGWSFVAAGLGLALHAFGGQYAIYTLLTDPGSLPGGAWLA
jgi:hypothetical protein